MDARSHFGSGCFFCGRLFSIVVYCNYMICMNCGVKTEKSTTTYVRDLGKCIIVIRNVPCCKCTECNETIYTGDVLENINRMVDDLKQQMTEIAVADYKHRIFKADTHFVAAV